MSVRSMASVRVQFSAVVSSVHDTHERVIVTRNGEPVVVNDAIDDLKSLEETLEILQKKTVMRGLARAGREVVAGDVITEAGVRELTDSSQPVGGEMITPVSGVQLR